MNKCLSTTKPGFIDPISLITLGIVVVGLVITTLVVKNPSINIATTDEPCKICSNQKCVKNPDAPSNCASSLNKCSTHTDCQTGPAPASTPPSLPPASAASTSPQSCNSPNFCAPSSACTNGAAGGVCGTPD
ncbi:MAG: hypothetical protein V1810_04310, partial [Candidatus Beckwithbacteria bacterium]